MVQELHVLKCFSCETFQSHIVKKTNKWECKVCGTKQSIKKVYGRGSGKDCRIHTQKLNSLKGEKEDLKPFDDQAHDGDIGEPLLHIAQQKSPQNTKSSNNEVQKHSSKWEEFLDKSKSTNQKSSYIEENTPHITSHVLSKNGNKRKRNVKISVSDTDGEYYIENSGNDSVDVYSDLFFSKSGSYMKQTKYSMYESKNFKENVNLGNCSLDGFETENKSPLLKMRKLAEKNTSNKVSLKWSKYLEPDETENVPCPNPSSFEIDGNVTDLFDHDNGLIDVCSEVKDCNYKVLNIHHKDIAHRQPELNIKTDQSLPVFEQTSDLNDNDFHLNF